MHAPFGFQAQRLAKGHNKAPHGVTCILMYTAQTRQRHPAQTQESRVLRWKCIQGSSSKAGLGPPVPCDSTQKNTETTLVSPRKPNAVKGAQMYTAEARQRHPVHTQESSYVKAGCSDVHASKVAHAQRLAEAHEVQGIRTAS